MEKLEHLDLFSGIGGFAMGLQETGYFKTVAFCDNEPAAQARLKLRFPGIPVYDDIHTIRSRYTGPAGIITAGFPCQPHSHAGKRRGAQDDRDLWPETRACVRHWRPTWFVGENVTGLESMAVTRQAVGVARRTLARYPDRDHYDALHTYEENLYLAQICKDLETDGYDVSVFVIPACAVNAPHIRNRVWIVAHTESDQGRRGHEPRQPHQHGGQSDHGRAPGLMADPARERMERHRPDGQRVPEAPPRSWLSGCDRAGIRGRNWPAEPCVGRMADGIPDRVDRLKGLGNAIVPEIAYRLADAIGQIESWKRRHNAFAENATDFNAGIGGR